MLFQNSDNCYPCDGLKFTKCSLLSYPGGGGGSDFARVKSENFEIVNLWQPSILLRPVDITFKIAYSL